MRFLVVLLAVMMLTAAASAQEADTDETAVSEKETAPYHTSLESATAAATGDQKIVVDFYTDW